MSKLNDPEPPNHPYPGPSRFVEQEEELKHPVLTVILIVVGVIVFLFGASFAIGVSELSTDPTVQVQKR